MSSWVVTTPQAVLWKLTWKRRESLSAQSPSLERNIMCSMMVLVGATSWTICWWRNLVRPGIWYYLPTLKLSSNVIVAVLCTFPWSLHFLHTKIIQKNTPSYNEWSSKTTFFKYLGLPSIATYERDRQTVLAFSQLSTVIIQKMLLFCPL